jgi:hypothetical protein
MKKVSLILLLLMVGAAYGQKQYLVEYDRIKNTEKYYQLVNVKGKSQEVKVDKPNLKKGDMVKFRVTNMNPMVFTFDVKSEKKDSEENKYTSNVLTGFSDVVGRMGGAIGDVSDNLSSLTGWNSPATPSFRGGSKVSEVRKLSLEKLSNFHADLKKSYSMLAQYQKAIEGVYSTELTKEEILSQLKVASGTFNSSEYNAQLRKLEDEYNDLKKDTIVYENERYEIDSAYVSLIEDIETTLASPNNANELLSIIESSTFSAEKTMVIGYKESSWGPGDLEELDDAGYVNYSINLKNLAKVDRDYENDNLLQNHDIQLSVQSPSNFSWATGLIFVSPFKGYNSYAIEEVGYDSLRVISGSPAPSMKFSVGTSLLYNFPSKGALLPHALFGASVGLSSDYSDKPVNFLLGGGLRIKQFSYVSFSAGLSFCQNTKLKNGFELGKTSLVPFSGDDLKNVSEKIFSPGYFFGININL